MVQHTNTCSYGEGTVWSHTQYNVSGHLIKDKSGLIRRSFTKLLTSHQKSWFASFALSCIFFCISLSFFPLRNCLRFAPHLLFNIKLKYVVCLESLQRINYYTWTSKFHFCFESHSLNLTCFLSKFPQFLCFLDSIMESLCFSPFKPSL